MKREADRWDEWVSCAISQTEVMRAARQAAAAAETEGDATEMLRRAEALLRRIPMIDADLPLLSQAAAVDPVSMRSLDAIHVAAALSLGQDLGALFTYDRRLADAAREHNLSVLSPA